MISADLTSVSCNHSKAWLMVRGRFASESVGPKKSAISVFPRVSGLSIRIGSAKTVSMQKSLEFGQAFEMVPNSRKAFSLRLRLEPWQVLSILAERSRTRSVSSGSFGLKEKNEWSGEVIGLAKRKTREAMASILASKVSHLLIFENREENFFA